MHLSANKIKDGIVPLGMKDAGLKVAFAYADVRVKVVS